MTEEKDKSINVGVNVTSTLLERVWGSLDQATAGLTKSWRIRREGRAVADARAYEMRLIAQAESDAAAIREGRARFGDDGKFALLPPPASPPSSTGLPDERTDIVKFLTDGAARIANDEALRQTTNLLRTAAKAEDFARESDAKPSTEEVDPDWLARWRRGAQDVSDEKLQQMWARLLLSEIEAPGGAPFRLMNLLSLLTKKDAQRVARLGPYAFDGGDIIEYLNMTEEDHLHVFPELKKEFDYDERLYLEELGIIAKVGTEMYRLLSLDGFHEGNYYLTMKVGKRSLVCFSPSRMAPFPSRGMNFTDVGRRLMRLGDFVANERYLRAVGGGLTRLGYQVRIGDLRPSTTSPGAFTVTNTVDL